MSKPIDQDRANFENWYLSLPYGSPNFYDLRELADGSYKFASVRQLWDCWRTRAAVQPAGVAVPDMPPTQDRRPYDDEEPDGYLEGNNDWAENNNEAVEWLADNHAAIRLALAAAPHPVSGEQKSVRRAPDTCNGNRCGWCNEGAEACKYSPVQRQFRDDEQRAWSALIEQPVAIAAQGVTGLVEALEQIENIELHSAGSVAEWHESRARIRDVIGRALAAHRAQQGEQP